MRRSLAQISMSAACLLALSACVTVTEDSRGRISVKPDLQATLSGDGPKREAAKTASPLGDMVLSHDLLGGNHRISFGQASNVIEFPEDTRDVSVDRVYGDSRRERIVVYRVERRDCPLSYEIVAVDSENLRTMTTGDCVNEMQFANSSTRLIGSIPAQGQRAANYWVYERGNKMIGPMDEGAYASYRNPSRPSTSVASSGTGSRTTGSSGGSQGGSSISTPPADTTTRHRRLAPVEGEDVPLRTVAVNDEDQDAAPTVRLD